MKIVITRKDNGIKEIECAGWCVKGGVLFLFKNDMQTLIYDNEYGETIHKHTQQNQDIYACTDWLDVEVVDE